jgi:hypothetical protein
MTLKFQSAKKRARGGSSLLLSEAQDHDFSIDRGERSITQRETASKPQKYLEITQQTCDGPT